MENTKLVYEQDFLDILFENRNKDYGAYQLRRKYVNTLMKAFGITLVILLLALGIPYLSQLLKGAADDDEARRKITPVILSEPPPVTEEPPTQEIIEPPKIEQIKFVAPEVTDQEVAPEDQMIEQEELKPNANIGTEDVEGDSILQLPTEIEVIEPPKKEEPVLFAQEMPTFPGGEAKMYEWLGKNVVYPEYAQKNDIQGRVVVKFVVNTNGEISDVQVLKSIPALDAEAIRLVKSMPKWKVGRHNGKPVAVWFTLPIKFELQ